MSNVKTNNQGIARSVVLLILDGWGQAPPWGGNAISVANTPNFDNLLRTCPHTLLGASGASVGLPGHERGNSEVGHLNLGSGRIPYMDSSKIWAAIKDGSFFGNSILLRAIDHCRKHHSRLHLMGLVSDGNIHSHIGHLFALLDLLKKEGLEEVYIHGFTDGRDAGPMSALTFFSNLEKKLREIGFGKIASLAGRYFAMDRDNHWDRTQSVYQTIALGKGNTADSALAAISQSYSEGKTDEFITPTVILAKGKPVATVQDNDAIVFFNFRSDRARQLATSFMGEKFSYFPRRKIANLFFVGMIPYGYEEELKLKLDSVFSQDHITNTLAENISRQGWSQFHTAETEKYAHVTYFFNGGKEDPFPQEDRLLIPSPRVASYDLAPEMSAREITNGFLERFKKKSYNFSVINFANPDMVGHTGNLKAGVKACEQVDRCLGQVIKGVTDSEGILLVTADHGNIEEMINPKTGEIDTEHSCNPVPFIYVDPQGLSRKLRSDGVLGDVAPTILDIYGLAQPAEMTGKKLFK